MGQHAAGQRQRVLQVGAVDVVPHGRRQVLGLDLPGHLGEPDDAQVVAREPGRDQRLEGHRHLLGRDEVVPHRHRKGEVERQHRRCRREALGPFDLEIVRGQPHRCSGASARHRVPDRPLDRQVERVAPLVGLGLVGPLMADADSIHGVAPHAVLDQFGKKVGQRVLTDLPQPSGGEFQPPLFVVDQTGISKLAGELGELFQRARRVVAEQFGGPLDVHLGQGAGVGGGGHHLLELVHVPQLVHDPGCLGEAQRIRPGEVVLTVPAGLRESLAQVGAEPVHLPAQVHVLQERFGQLLQLGSLLRAHGVEQLLHGGHLAGHQLEQLVKVLRVAGEHVPVAVHELLEHAVGVTAGGAGFQHLIEVVEHVFHALHRLGRHVRHGRRHLVEVALHELRAELLHELVEGLTGLAAGPLVLLEGLHLASQIGRQQVQGHASFRGHLVGDLGSALVARLLGLVDQILDSGSFLVDDLPQALGDVLVRPTQVVPVEHLPPTLPESLEDLSHTGDALTVAVLETPLHKALEGLVEVAVVEKLVREFAEDVVGVELETDLGAIPLGVPEPGHRRSG